MPKGGDERHYVRHFSTPRLVENTSRSTEERASENMHKMDKIYKQRSNHDIYTSNDTRRGKGEETSERRRRVRRRLNNLRICPNAQPQNNSRKKIRKERIGVFQRTCA